MFNPFSIEMFSYMNAKKSKEVKPPRVSIINLPLFANNFLIIFAQN